MEMHESELMELSTHTDQVLRSVFSTRDAGEICIC